MANFEPINFFSLNFSKIEKFIKLVIKIGQSSRSAPTTYHLTMVFLSAVSSALARSRQASLEIKSNQRGGNSFFQSSPRRHSALLELR